MADNNQAYTRRCGECGKCHDKLTLTKISFNEGKRRYKPLCAEYLKRYEA